MPAHFQHASDEWETPNAFYAALDAEFGFALDVCATASNAKCKRFYTPEVNGLWQPWEGVCWCNPPYGREIRQWLSKARDSANEGATVVCLVPARTDTGWWHDHVLGVAEVRYVRGRLRFGGSASPAPFASAVVVYRAPPHVIASHWLHNSAPSARTGGAPAAIDEERTGAAP